LGRKRALRRISVENRVDIGGGEDGLVVVAAEAVVGVSGAGHDAAAVVVAGNVAVVAQCTIFGIETIAAWIVHELALAAIANACRIVWVVTVAAAMVGDAGDIGVGGGECVVAAVDVVVGVI